METDATDSLRHHHLNTIQDALCALKNLSLLADTGESTRLEPKRIVSHRNVLRPARLKS